MSYQVIARKWRPQVFSDVIGQEHVTRTLANAIEHDTIGHAFLFAGPRGVGKTTTARILAKCLNCETGITATPCNKCSPCLEINAGTSFDVLEIDGASNRGIDEIRELKENARYAPANLRTKVFIIDEVHMLTKEAFNALLKTLEEPPPYVKFIMATTEAHKIPDTILSRCQRYEFRLVNATTLEQMLRKITDAEGVMISDASLRLIVRMAEGSVRDSESLLEQVIAFGGSEISDEDVALLTNSLGFEALRDLAEGLLAGDIDRVLLQLKQIVDGGYVLNQIGKSLAQFFRDVLIVKVTKNPGELLDRTDDELAALRLLGENVSADKIQQQFLILQDAEDALRHSSYPQFVMELTFMKMARVGDFEDLGSVLDGLGNLLQRGQITLSPTPAPVAAPSAAPAPPAASSGTAATAVPPPETAPAPQPMEKAQSAAARPQTPKATASQVQSGSQARPESQAEPEPPAPPVATAVMELPVEEETSAANLPWVELLKLDDEAKMIAVRDALRERNENLLATTWEKLLHGSIDDGIWSVHWRGQEPVGLNDHLSSLETFIAKLTGKPFEFNANPVPDDLDAMSLAEQAEAARLADIAELKAKTLASPLLRQAMKDLGLEESGIDDIKRTSSE